MFRATYILLSLQVAGKWIPLLLIIQLFPHSMKSNVCVRFLRKPRSSAGMALPSGVLWITSWGHVARMEEAKKFCSPVWAIKAFPIQQFYGNLNGWGYI